MVVNAIDHALGPEQEATTDGYRSSDRSRKRGAPAERERDDERIPSPTDDGTTGWDGELGEEPDGVDVDADGRDVPTARGAARGLVRSSRTKPRRQHRCGCACSGMDSRVIQPRTTFDRCSGVKVRFFAVELARGTATYSSRVSPRTSLEMPCNRERTEGTRFASDVEPHRVGRTPNRTMRQIGGWCFASLRFVFRSYGRATPSSPAGRAPPHS